MFTMRVLRHFVRESYSQPADVYAQLKRCGMDLVTITDHDSIDAAEPLRRHPDFFLSEEVTATLPSGNEAHIGVYDITEKQHLQIQRRRTDFFALLAYLSERRIFASVNHIFSGLTGPRRADDFDWFARGFAAFETRNGQLPAELNARAARLAQSLGKTPLGGSDAHALCSAGRTWTEVRGARTKQDFLDALRAGAGHVGGEHGSYGKLTRDVFCITAGYMAEQPLAALLAPIALAIPFFTLSNYASEMLFARRWSRQLAAAERSPALPAFSNAQMARVAMEGAAA